jgi:serine/threonine protein kinase
MKRQTPIPEELWDQCPPAAQAAILGLIVQYEQQLRAAHSGPPPTGSQSPPPSGAPVRLEGSGIAELVGKTFSHFEIGALVATGNSGAIFRAKDTTKPYRTVAFQVLRPELSGGDDEKERFAKTMVVIRSLRHPSLVRVYSAGRSGPHNWIAMKYIEGESLAQVLQKSGVAGRLNWRATFTIAVSLTAALHQLHQQKVLHRNLKPANVMIRKEDRKALLGDFSRTRPLHGARVERLPWPGQLVGDLTYLAPEQTQPGTVEDGRCDIYGLGATLYTLLAGRPPFEAGTIDKMVEKIRGEEPPNAKEFQLAIPEAVEGLVMRMLSKRPDVRFQSTREVLHDLERIAKIHQLVFDPDETSVKDVEEKEK